MPSTPALAPSIPNIGFISFLLARVAGYCDTITFVAGDAIFSAHVTGNFIVFAAQVMLGPDKGAFVKLITFPLFVVFVIAGGEVIFRYRRQKILLSFQCLLLVAAGILAAWFEISSLVEGKWGIYVVVMLVVAAMGLQNAYGKLFAKQTHGPTTMMTGNVTQASLDLGRLLFNPTERTAGWVSLNKQGSIILGFLTGCLCGAIAGKVIGLASVFLAGVVIGIVAFITGKNEAADR